MIGNRVMTCACYDLVNLLVASEGAVCLCMRQIEIGTAMWVLFLVIGHKLQFFESGKM